MLRVLHFSDVHVYVPMWRMPKRELWNKRLLGGANLMLRRRPHFRDAARKLQELARFAGQERVDVCICTGDYTALGTEPELHAARAAVDALAKRPLGMVTVPGNHDLYLPDTVDDGRFDRVFGEFTRTDLPEARVDGPWPSVRLFGEHLAVVAVNSARPNPQPWRSSGRIPAVQLRALAALLDDPRLRERHVLVATHYAPRKRDGSPDHPSHGLENAEELLSVCTRSPRVAILHGHIHWRYHIRLPAPGPRLFSAGSTTYAGREGLWLFEVDAQRVVAFPGNYAEGGYAVDRERAITITRSER